MRYVFLPVCYWLFLGSAMAQRTTLVAASSSQAVGSLAATPAPGALISSPPVAAEGTTATVYNFVDEMPAFPGGQAAFAQFMRRTLQYPDAALAANISGKVHVRFTVSEDGHLLNPEVVKGLGYGLDQEALRLVRLMPWWTPGKVNGQPVRVRYVLPLVFRAL
jgi:protein TonB